MMAREARRTLLLLALVCILPVAASYLAYYVWPPRDTVNYGELIEPVAIAGDLSDAGVRGRWALVFASSGPCAEACRQALYYMRQVRLAQGEHMHRVGRLWLRAQPDPPAAALLAEHEGLIVVAAARERLGELPGLDRVMLLDPAGRLMMRYPESPDPQRMIRDLARLLKYSRVG